MSLCLVVQKDTLENDKVKSVIKTCDVEPNDFLKELQTGHCIEYQLLAHVKSSDVNEKVFTLISPYKTNYGKDWYELNHDTLAQIISLFLETDVSVVNLRSISEIMRFNLKIYPVVNREIIVSSISSPSTSSTSSNSLETDKTDKTDKTDNKNDKEEIISLIDTIKNFEKSELPKKKKDYPKKKN